MEAVPPTSKFAETEAFPLTNKSRAIEAVVLNSQPEAETDAR